MPDAASNNIFVEPRERLVDWVRRQLIGPPLPAAGGLDANSDIYDVSPIERYPCGAIYPILPGGEGIDAADEDGDVALAGSDAPDDASADPVVMRRYVPPSSLGLSFFIKGETIRFQLLWTAARYEPKETLGQFRRPEWTRIQLGGDGDVRNVTCPGRGERQRFNLLDGRAHLDVLWRPFAEGWIVTTTLCNAQHVDANDAKEFVKARTKATLFEARLRCVIDEGETGVYPRVDRSLLDDEEQEVELQYVRRHIYAIGHGCAADWLVPAGRVTELRTETMPTVEVPQMTADTGADGDDVLCLSRLARADAHYEGELAPKLKVFVDGYAEWAARQADSLPNLLSDDRPAGERIAGRIKTAIARMRTGLELLRREPSARLAFALANRAMLDQMRQHDSVQGKSRQDDAYRWRPFQLAFLLTVLESTANGDSEFRDTVDLIWFPTGGGKTEAYLGLIAFQIVLRRLRHSATGGGTCVLMRYTLRLLTRDQFLRASRLICALELIRSARQDLGSETISIGMWVGDATSPNRYEKAAELVARAKLSRTLPALVIDRCPWCGEGFAADRNYDARSDRFHFVCRHDGCAFKGRVLPCNVVDEALYDEPPTMLVATVDKFARLAWEERSGAFFGAGRCRPPELIIQDELHLIAGALGTVAGLYEAGVDAVVRLRDVYPKYIASTATIRMAAQQVRRLYGREVAVFPPPGLNCDDSYFARTVPLAERPGRLYVGYLAPMLNRQRCMAPLAAALLLAPHELFAEDLDREALLDAWWTQVVYHGSLKGVGNSHTAYVGDVGSFKRLLLEGCHPVGHADAGSDSVKPEDPRSAVVVAQLTSLQTAEQNSAIFSRLTKPRGDDGCLDAVLATNMVSVGLDVARLALMTINGQPLTTSEYIQASSRVGRSEVPGIVFANYYRQQARSLSHYESFRPYHEAFYRFVEPTSVTPFSHQARQRALHAALVIVMRHAGVGLQHNDSAGRFNPGAAPVAKAIHVLKQRCKDASGDSPAAEVFAHIDDLVAAWRGEVERCETSRRGLHYQVADNEAGYDRLLYNHTDKIPGLWPTLQSLRNVESTALLKTL
jgi:hypothetical protein